MSASITLSQLSKTYGSTCVIPDLSAEFAAHEFTVILGPSGCGKSTLLNMIAGLEAVTSGEIAINGTPVQDKAPKDRGIAMVFQNYALYPHMSVADNIGYALKVAGVPKKERIKRIQSTAEIVNLSQYLDRRPSELSGGQRQRVAIGRAIVREPSVLLYDEPLSNLDAKLRQAMRMQLSDLHGRTEATSVFVTHDQVEAMTLADKILILNQGKIEQFDTPSTIYHKPASSFVAGFIGAPPMNLLQPLKNLPCPENSIVGIRPEHVVLAAQGFSARVTYKEDLGAQTITVLRLEDGQTLQMLIPYGSPPPQSEDVRVAFPDTELHFFSAQTGLRHP